jgi:hypothetical protein
MRTYNGVLDRSHLRAAIRLALRAHGFTVSNTSVDSAVEARDQLGCWLRDQVLPQRFPRFASRADYYAIAEIDPCLWGGLPPMLGFGYQQAMVLHGLVAPSSEVDVSVATLGAMFSAGIALVDYLVDTQPDGMRVFEMLNRNVVRGMFDLATDTEAALASAYEQVTDLRLRLLCALVSACAAGFRELYCRSRNEVAWVSLAQVMSCMYEAEWAVSLVTPTSRAALRELLPVIEAKSVLPFVSMHQVVTLAASQPEAPERAEHASETLGRIVSLTDDLVDLMDDCHRGAPNTLILYLADRLAEQGRDWPSDADVYEVVDASVRDLLELLQLHAFALADATVSANPEITKADCGAVEPDATDTGLVAVLDFARITVAAWVGWHEENGGEIPAVHTKPGGHPTQNNPTLAATEMLLAQQCTGYHEAIHHLLLPRLYPTGMRLETYPALLFQRAIVLDGLLDAHATGHPVPHAMLAAEACEILRAKHRDARGGWNYIPEVPELPPDADDLGMVLQVLCRLGGPALASTCDEAIRLAIASARPDGGFSTWILDPNGCSELDQTMHSYIEVTESAGVHPDVVANLLYGLILYDPERYHDVLLRAVPYLEAVQDDRGFWRSRWYAGPYYGTYRAVSALSCLIPDSGVLERARTFCLRSQRSDGSWGERRSDPLATAFAILALAKLDRSLEDTAIEQGVSYLIGTQEADGGWPASPFISFPTSDGAGLHRYASRTITTTFCLKALLAIVNSQRLRPDNAGVFVRAPWPMKPVSAELDQNGWS